WLRLPDRLATHKATSVPARTSLQDYLLKSNPTERAALRKQMAVLDSRLADLARQLDEADTDRQDVQPLAKLTQTWKAYAAWRDSAILGALELPVVRRCYGQGLLRLG